MALIHIFFIFNLIHFLILNILYLQFYHSIYFILIFIISNNMYISKNYNQFISHLIIFYHYQ